MHVVPSSSQKMHGAWEPCTMLSVKAGLQEMQPFLSSLLQLQPQSLFEPHCAALLDKASAPSLLLSAIFGAAALSAAQQALQVGSEAPLNMLPLVFWPFWQALFLLLADTFHTHCAMLIMCLLSCRVMAFLYFVLVLAILLGHAHSFANTALAVFQPTKHCQAAA